MDTGKAIFFEETSSNPAEFISELGDSRLYRSKSVSAQTTRILRRQQVGRLEANIDFLRQKQNEFNRKMEEYIESIRSLIRSLEQSVAGETTPLDARPIAAPAFGTQVKCLLCGREAVFRDIQVIVARDSMDSIQAPTELIVERGGLIKKGSFRCPECGNENLSIREMNG